MIEVLRLRRSRRLAAAAIALAGLLDLASALTPPLRDRLHAELLVVPLAVPQVATSLVALAGIALLVLARGVRSGQQRAWACSVGLLAGSAVLHLVKGADVEETVVALAVAAWLVHARRAFRAPSSESSPLVALVGVVFGAAVLGVAIVEVLPLGRPHPGLVAAVVAVGSRLAWLPAGRPVLVEGLDEFLTPALGAVGLSLVAGGGWLLFRPGRWVRARGGHERARSIVDRWGSDTLAYFALRDDKSHFFWGDTVVAFAVIGGVCLVSPDPIGPPAEAEAAWREFRAFAQSNGWPVAVLGATEEWLPRYRTGGMSSFYVGDEAVVDCQTFSLKGGRFKGLRQAVNRIEKYGYTISFHDPASVAPELRSSLVALAAESRQGDAERGFSMTLGRLFDARDTGLLLAVASDASGVPVAFCQWVPAPCVDGYSLDLMRRSRSSSHPNGLTDFVVVRTIEHLRSLGARGLALNFATMRAVLSGSLGDGLARRGERWVLLRLSESMQIESLWKYNAKFDPAWRGRYAVYESVGMLVPAALAAARAESFSDLPVIGRFLVGAGSPRP
jgi:lysylphosphatidylglycerol synthetase-like protein (DUF2156 family)